MAATMTALATCVGKPGRPIQAIACFAPSIDGNRLVSAHLDAVVVGRHKAYSERCQPDKNGLYFIGIPDRSCRVFILYEDVDGGAWHGTIDSWGDCPASSQQLAVPLRGGSPSGFLKSLESDQLMSVMLVAATSSPTLARLYRAALLEMMRRREPGLLARIDASIAESQYPGCVIAGLLARGMVSPRDAPLGLCAEIQAKAGHIRVGCTISNERCSNPLVVYSEMSLVSSDVSIRDVSIRLVSAADGGVTWLSRDRSPTKGQLYLRHLIAVGGSITWTAEFDSGRLPAGVYDAVVVFSAGGQIQSDEDMEQSLFMSTGVQRLTLGDG